MIQKNGKTSSTRYILSDRYFELARKTSQIAGYSISEIDSIAECLSRVKSAKMKDFAALFEGKLKRSQVRYLIEKLVDNDVLVMDGKGSGARYKINTTSPGECDIKKMIIARLKEKEQKAQQL